MSKICRINSVNCLPYVVARVQETNFLFQVASSRLHVGGLVPVRHTCDIPRSRPANQPHSLGVRFVPTVYMYPIAIYTSSGCVSHQPHTTLDRSHFQLARLCVCFIFLFLPLKQEPLSAAAEARLSALPDLSYMLSQRIRFPMRAAEPLPAAAATSEGFL